MTEEESTMVVEAMTAIPFFPPARAAQGLISSELQAMCGTLAQGTWLARRMLQLFNRWPGAKEMRAAYCAKFRPLDGTEAYSETYPDGIPSERENRTLIAGAVHIAELPEQERKLLGEVAEACGMPKR